MDSKRTWHKRLRGETTPFRPYCKSSCHTVMRAFSTQQPYEALLFLYLSRAGKRALRPMYCLASAFMASVLEILTMGWMPMHSRAKDVCLVFPGTSVTLCLGMQRTAQNADSCKKTVYFQLLYFSMLPSFQILCLVWLAIVLEFGVKTSQFS